MLTSVSNFAFEVNSAENRGGSYLRVSRCFCQHEYITKIDARDTRSRSGATSFLSEVSKTDARVPAGERIICSSVQPDVDEPSLHTIWRYLPGTAFADVADVGLEPGTLLAAHTNSSWRMSI